MTDRDTIVETVTRLFRATDRHRWDDLAAVFRDPVTIDYTAARGGEPEVLSPAGVVAAWAPLFSALDAHRHLVTNHLVTVDGDRATMSAAFLATHQWRGETWTLGGDYAFDLVRAAAGGRSPRCV